MARDGAGGADEAVGCSPTHAGCWGFPLGLAGGHGGRLSGGGKSLLPSNASPSRGAENQAPLLFPWILWVQGAIQKEAKGEGKESTKNGLILYGSKKKNKCDIYLTFNVVEKCTPMSLRVPSVARVFISDRFYWKWFIIGWRYVCLNSLFSDSVRYFQRKKK